jgi:tetratricopeptide (TPR) repeat protein
MGPTREPAASMISDRVRLFAKMNRGDYVGARRLLRSWLKADPDEHWVMAKMAQTYEEQKQYRTALNWAMRALRIRPRCPIALWELAYILNEQGRFDHAAAVYRALIRRSMRSYTTGPCAQSRAWAERFVSDCWMSLAWLEQYRGRHRASVEGYRQHIRRRLKNRMGGIGGRLRRVRAKMAIQEGLAKKRSRRPQAVLS